MHLFYQPRLDLPVPALPSAGTPGTNSLPAEWTDAVLHLTEDDSRHAMKTLRLKPGDAIAVTDGRGNQYSAIITPSTGKLTTFRITDTRTTPPRPFSIRICVAPTKSPDRIEWFVEKAVEIGVERVSFFFGKHSERRVLKLERIEKIAAAAMKQSLQSWLPQFDDAVPFADLLQTIGEPQRFIAHLPADESPANLIKAATPGGHYVVLIGPEGDFSDTELNQARDAGFQLTTLGSNRLRTETAALAACQALNFINF